MTSQSTVIPPAGAPAAATGEFIWKVHAYTNEYIRFADTKAAAVIAWSGGLIGVLISAKAHHHFMKSPFAWGRADPGVTALAVASVLAFALLAAAVWCAFWCVKPRLWSKDGTLRHAADLIYWEEVRVHVTNDAYWTALYHQSPEALAGSTARHVYALAGIVKTKYWWVDWSIWAAFFGSVIAAGVTLFS